MGALHDGHLSLVAAARQGCHTVVLSIFVNPTQFGPGEDLDAYPRDAEGDCAKAAAAGVDILFAPTVDEMYPARRVFAGRLGEIWEGASRPGHFDGVATVVSRLFDLIRPCRAYFGEKDYQQLLVVRRLAAEYPEPSQRVEVLSCPTVREHDGLALSSRNVRLTPSGRSAATVLYRTLLAGRAAVEAGRGDATTVMQTIIRAEPRARLDYAAVTDASTLEPALTPPRGELRLLVAAHVDGVRLIDNLRAHA
jgi:pantoate--beta-alanine ligase